MATGLTADVEGGCGEMWATDAAFLTYIPPVLAPVQVFVGLRMGLIACCVYQQRSMNLRPFMDVNNGISLDQAWSLFK